MQLLLPTLSSAICVPLRRTELLNIRSGDLEQTERASKLSAGLRSLQSTIQEESMHLLYSLFTPIDQRGRSPDKRCAGKYSKVARWVFDAIDFSLVKMYISE